MITVCDTCAYSAEEEFLDGRSGGRIFAEHVEAAAAGRGVSVRRFSCLMGCKHHCNAAISDHGKLTYVLGSFEPTADAAQALVDFASLYAESRTGAVPYKTWPQGVKGHFVSRTPPLDGFGES